MARVLIIDDEPSYREYLTRYLTRESYDVRAAGTRDEAFEIAATFSPDVVLADWMLLDDEHGLEVAESLRKDAAAIQIVIMTGFATAEIREEARRAGVRGVLEKPFGLAELATAIANATHAPDASDPPI